MRVGALALLLTALLPLAAGTAVAGAKKGHRPDARSSQRSQGNPGSQGAQGGQGDCVNANVPLRSLALDQVNSVIACLINLERVSHGLPALRIQSQLRTAARAHNADMQQTLHTFTHDASNGDSFAKRIGRSGYMKKSKQWAVGEILDETPAQGQTGNNVTTPNDALDAWLVSSAHNRIIHIARFRDFGVDSQRGTAEDPSVADGALITVDFGFRR